MRELPDVVAGSGWGRLVEELCFAAVGEFAVETDQAVVVDFVHFRVAPCL